MSPKSLLRHPMALSSFEEIEPGTTFQPILPDPFVKPGNIQKVLICSGKVFYDLVTERQEKQLEGKIAIIRIEQLCPFPYHRLKQEVSKYPNAKVREIDSFVLFVLFVRYRSVPRFNQIVWLQEEHKNQGPYNYVRDRIALALGLRLEDVTYGGRAPSAAPSTGSKMIYSTEYNDMMSTVMKLD